MYTLVSIKGRPMQKKTRTWYSERRVEYIFRHGVAQLAQELLKLVGLKPRVAVLDARAFRL